MKETIVRFKEKIVKSFGPSEAKYADDVGSDYLEITNISESPISRTKITVRPFIVEDFSDIKPILDVLREGYTIALVNIKPIKDKDIIELKRVIAKLKKTCEAIEGDIAGFGEDWIVATPSFARVYRSTQTEVFD